VVELAKAAVAAMKVGDPADPATTIGPLANRNQFDRVQGYISRGLMQGATLVAGGEGRPRGFERGYFVKPTVFANVSNDMAIAQEEIFGPVLCIITYRDEDEAVAIANDSSFGLHAYVFSSDVLHAQAIARRLEVGRVAINGMQHDPLAPFGGVKQSGVSREFGPFGLESFLEAKTVMVA